MIIQRHEQSAHLLVDTLHNEYPLPDTVGVRLINVWNAPEILEVSGYINGSSRLHAVTDLEEETITDAFRKLFPGLEQKFGLDLTFANLYTVSGLIDDLKSYCLAYIAIVGEGPVGGDDDTFDYWPSAVSVAHELAWDVAELTQDSEPVVAYIAMLRASRQRVADMAKEHYYSADDFDAEPGDGLPMYNEHVKPEVAPMHEHGKEV